MKLLVLLSLVLMNFFVFSSEIQSQVINSTHEYCVNHSTVPGLPVQEITQFNNVLSDFPEIYIPSKIKKEKIQSNSFFVDSIKGYFFNDSIAIQIFKYNEQGLMIEKLELLNWFGVLDTSSRRKYDYDDSGNILSEIYEIYSLGEWYGEYNKKYSYDKSNNVTEIYIEQLNGMLPTEEKHIYEWNSDNKLTLHLYYSRILNPELKLYASDTYTYDEFGNLTLKIYERNHDKFKIKNFFYYDENNNIIEQSEEESKDSVFLGKHKYLFEYDDFNRQLSKALVLWKYDEWSNGERYVYSYDEYDNLLTKIYQHWVTNDWVNKSKRSNIYENNLLISETINDWSDYKWRLRFKNDFHYNQNSQIISEEYYTRFYESFDLNRKVSFDYDINDNLNLVTFLQSDGNNMNSDIGDAEFYDYSNNSYNCSGYKIEIFWSQTSTPVINEAEYKHNISCYPNPVSETTNISFSLENENYVSLQITNTLGQVVGELIINKFMESGEHNFDFDASNLTSGMYFVCLRVGAEVVIGKMVVKD